MRGDEPAAMSASDLSLVVRTHDPEETRAVGAAIGRSLAGAATISLTGPLGAGKTVLARGICEGLGVDDPVTSPTFTLQNQYTARSGRRILHLDCFRIASAAEFEDLATDDLREDDTVAIVEWGERAETVLGPDAIRITIEAEAEDRKISIRVPPGLDLELSDAAGGAS